MALSGATKVVKAMIDGYIVLWYYKFCEILISISLL